MPRNNQEINPTVTPINELQQKLNTLKPGEFITFPQSKESVLKTRENLVRRRHELSNADAHVEYIEACLVAEASGKLRFVG